MKGALPRLALALAVAAVLAGCGSGLDHAQRLTLVALATQAHVPASSSGSSKSCADTRNLTASLRPPAAMPSPGAMPAGSFMNQIRRRGYLIAGVDQNTYRFAYFNPLIGQIEGFEVDLLKQIANAILGNRPGNIEFKAVTTSERITAVQSGSVDIVADAMTITCERKKSVDFSTVYYDAGQRLLVPVHSRVRSVKDLGGQRVCVTRTSTSLITLLAQRPRPVPFEVAQRTDCLRALQEGLVSAITSDDSILLGFKAQDPDTQLVGPRFADEPYGMAISKAHPEFVRFVNGVLARLRSDGTWRAIYARWLGRFVPTIPHPPAAAYDG